MIQPGPDCPKALHRAFSQAQNLFGHTCTHPCVWQTASMYRSKYTYWCIQSSVYFCHQFFIDEQAFSMCGISLNLFIVAAKLFTYRKAPKSPYWGIRHSGCEPPPPSEPQIRLGVGITFLVGEGCHRGLAITRSPKHRMGLAVLLINKV